MKFGKSLGSQIEEALPDWRDKFLSYKELKKRLKMIESKGGERINKRPRLDGDRTEIGEMTREEMDFIRILEAELEKFNGFFVDKEEEYIISRKELQDRVAKAKDSNELIKVRKEIVDFHGEMVLLANYSALNYTGLVKILKKYDKRTGALIRLPFIKRVLQQPFYSTDLLYQFIKECESTLDQLFPVSVLSISREDNSCELRIATEKAGLLNGPKELEDIKNMESMYLKKTLSALKALKEIRSRSSTVSVFSLPPLQSIGMAESWSKIPAVEQLAK
eukprot:TRINITY_DN4643_c0_g2_i1.p1 TRINITY_DN4643_c0_g2~~TRINITY_DN4643_c0_g2_i1.p1  ORF type:complete len:277 (+),score=50.30 TRINITY_DN4643_c0_g2_i1:149-979(+)